MWNKKIYLLILAAFLMNILIIIDTNKSIYVDYEGEIAEVSTNAITVDMFRKQYDDKLQITSEGTIITDGTLVAIREPKVITYVDTNGDETKYDVYAANFYELENEVEELVSTDTEKFINITTREVYFSENDPITVQDGDRFTIAHLEVEENVKIEDIPAEYVYQDIYGDTEKVQQCVSEPVIGKKEVTTKTYTLNEGEKTYTEVVDETIVDEGENGECYRYWKRHKITTYGPFQYENGIAQTGCAPYHKFTADNYMYNDPEYGQIYVVAAPLDIPCGSIFYVEGLGYAIKLDNGGQIVQDQRIIDVLRPTMPARPTYYDYATILRWGW